MNWRVRLLAAAGAMLTGCVTPPTDERAPSPGPPAEQTPASRPPATDGLEQRHRERAQAYEREGNWADALVEWELLALIKPDAVQYRDAAAATRARIRAATAGLLRAAEFARRQGNLDQATLLYLRALNLDREDAAAAQALRDIDAERTQRAYLNRPPRGAY
jgi:tetratricopeptide (TPR) repeat protein